MEAQLDKLSYSLQALADATDLSVDSIQKAIKKDELVPSYFGSKPIVLVEEARRWLKALPNEKQDRSS